MGEDFFQGPNCVSVLWKSFPPPTPHPQVSASASLEPEWLHGKKKDKPYWTEVWDGEIILGYTLALTTMKCLHDEEIRDEFDTGEVCPTDWSRIGRALKSKNSGSF